ncbi:hypothetical protein Cgig2_006213 [Carnegiea gigantea]|uniref:Uncharacterized protein n=1 Tax=Carnegiea gigantea TaxID=171969 RepID=A0A9Q1KZH9_9CARY|nr:hypothetical protein Cgig2_006213 [Carnegiea gigantea]
MWSTELEGRRLTTLNGEYSNSTMDNRETMLLFSPRHCIRQDCGLFNPGGRVAEREFDVEQRTGRQTIEHPERRVPWMTEQDGYLCRVIISATFLSLQRNSHRMQAAYTVNNTIAVSHLAVGGGDFGQKSSNPNLNLDLPKNDFNVKANFSTMHILRPHPKGKKALFPLVALDFPTQILPGLNSSASSPQRSSSR